MEPMCPKCHAIVRPTDYFCYNCGKNLKPAPLSLAVDKLAMYYIGAVLLPPMGIIWGWKYYKEGNPTAKILIPMHWGDIVGSRADAETVKKLFKGETVIKEKEK